MVRLARALAFTVPPAEVLVVVLLLSGVSLPTPVLVAAELAVAAVIVLEATTAWRLSRADRRAGLGRRAAAAAVWHHLVPAPARRALEFEAKGAMSVLLWLLRRRDRVPPGATALPYAREQWPMLLVVVGVLAVEGAVADVLLAVFDAATAIRVVVFVLHVYTIWLTLVVGASCTVRPHVVTGEVLRVRYGVFLDLTVPRSLITAVRLAHRYDEPRAVGVEGDRLAVAVGSRTNVVVELAEPVTVVRPLGSRAEVTEIRFFTAEPGRAVAALSAGKTRSDA